MLLRTRITLIVFLVASIVAAGLVFAVLQRERATQILFSESIINDRATLWDRTTEAIILRMEDKAWIAAEDEPLLKALAGGSQEAIGAAAATVSDTLMRRRLATRFDLVDVNGSLLYSSHPAIFQSAVSNRDVVLNAMRTGSRFRGIGNDRNRNVVIALGLPLEYEGEMVGLGIIASDVTEAIERMARSTGSQVMIVNRRGRLLAGAETDLWASLAADVDVLSPNTMQTTTSGDQAFASVVLPLTADVGSLVARIIVVKDVTATFWEQRNIDRIAAITGVTFIALVLVTMSWYLRRSFTPLTDGVDVLNALSKGNTQARIEHVESDDEVGRIAQAVNRFRADLIALERIQRSRAKQRRRQERFIRYEMTELAETLDDRERAAVMKELTDIEDWVKAHQDGSETALGEMQNIDKAQPVGGGLAMMALAFGKMSGRVRDQNQRLRDALATKTAFLALQRELKLARRVQLAFLPPPMPASDLFEIAGSMKPAKDVGGDFYDFFYVDEHRLGVVVADVSGKGVPAALFMAVSRTLIQATAQYVHSPAQCLRDVNDLLEATNEQDMFVTVLYGVLDLRDGSFTYANAGHHPPVMIGTDEAVALSASGELVLAALPGIQYTERTVQLQPDTRLLLYTDGVTEAFSPDGVEFGEHRLMQAIAESERGTAEDEITQIVSAVERFAAGEAQADDITCVILHYKQPAAIAVGAD